MEKNQYNQAYFSKSKVKLWRFLSLPLGWMKPWMQGLDRLNQARFQIAASQFVRELLEEQKYSESHLSRCGYAVYSQGPEDGMIQEIFNRIGVESKTFLEFGIGDGLETNTALLARMGWEGVWVEGGEKFCRLAGVNAASLLDSSVRLKNVYVTPENIDEIALSASTNGCLDFLSIDVDSIDYSIWRGLEAVRPRVVCVEYNAKFPPPIDFVFSSASIGTRKSDEFGASLAAMYKLGMQKGYALVGCSLTGANAFFVREDLVSDHFVNPNDVAFHYEPPRYWLAWRNDVGLPASFNEMPHRAAE